MLCYFSGIWYSFRVIERLRVICRRKKDDNNENTEHTLCGTKVYYDKSQDFVNLGIYKNFQYD